MRNAFPGISYIVRQDPDRFCIRYKTLLIYFPPSYQHYFGNTITWPSFCNFDFSIILLYYIFSSFACLITFSGVCLCRGVDLTSWKENLQKEAEPADLANFVRHLSENHVFPNKVLVDCTADANVASHYYDWLKKGIHVITPNKKANSGPLDQVNI